MQIKVFKTYMSKALIQQTDVPPLIFRLDNFD